MYSVCFLETLRVYERFTIRGVANHGQLRRLTIEETMISRVNPVSRYNAPMIAVSRWSCASPVPSRFPTFPATIPLSLRLRGCERSLSRSFLELCPPIDPSSISLFVITFSSRDTSVSIDFAPRMTIGEFENLNELFFLTKFR